VVSLEQARTMATQEGLDLMLVSDAAVPPVCKLVDFGQFKYQQAKRDKQQRKSTKSQVTKELKVGHKISDHDYQVKLAKGREFLEKRYKLKITVMFRGREIMHIELGRKIISRYIEDVKDLGTGDEVVQSGKSLGVMINPK
jgi:translation initiation factor IF-3